MYAISTVLASLGWLAWDASEYAKVAPGESPDVLLSSMSIGDVLKSYLQVFASELWRISSAWPETGG